MKLANKVAIITGAGIGIGRVYAKALAKEGASITIADLDAEAGERTAAEIMTEGGQAIALVTDVSKEDEIQRMAEDTVRAFGGIDILVNNAGMHLMEYNVPCTQLDVGKWRHMLDVNLTGAMLCAAACHSSMKKRGGGVIVNQSSIAAYMAAGAYGVSKLALNGLTMALATEFAPDKIRVHGIAPGLIESEALLAEMPEEAREKTVANQLIKKPGQMTDLVGLMVFLCSEESSMITSQTWIVDGGMIRRV